VGTAGANKPNASANPKDKRTRKVKEAERLFSKSSITAMSAVNGSYPDSHMDRWVPGLMFVG